MAKRYRSLAELSVELLDIPDPWHVLGIDERDDDAPKGLAVRVAHQRRATMSCPRCDFATTARHDTVTREWRDLDWGQHQVHLRAEVPRIRCPEHGVVRVAVPWAARERVTVTQRFEAHVLTLLATCSVSETARLLDVSFKQIARIQNDAVARGLARRELQPTATIGVDETSFRKRHNYVTVVNDLQGTVLHVTPGRDANALADYFEALGEDGASAVEHVVMDMSAPYAKAVDDYTDATIVIDKFHVIAALTKAVDQVRRMVTKEFQARGDDRMNGTMHLWRRSAATRSDRETAKFNELKGVARKVARAWERVEAARELFSAPDMATAERQWRRWIRNARLSRLAPVRKAANTVENHLPGIVNASVTKLTNAAAESMNAKIQKVKRMANGYRNKANFCNAIYFHFGKLDMSF